MRSNWLIRHPYVAAAAFFMAGWLVLSWPWLSGAVTIPFDAKAHFQAQLQFLANALHSGQSPFWTPNIFGGSPQIADPQSLIFSPAILLAIVSSAPSFQMLDTFILAMLAMAGLATIGFFRERGWHAAGGLVAAFAVAFGASAAWRLQHIGQIESFALYFLTLFLLERALRRNSLLYGVLSGLSAGLMVVQPNQIAYLACMLLVGQVIDHIVRIGVSVKTVKRFAPTLGCASLAGFAVILVPVILTVLFAEGSNRTEINFAEAARGSLHPLHLLTAFVADLFGAADRNVPYWGPSSMNWDAESLNITQNMGQVYIGALPMLALVVLGLWRGNLLRSDIRFFTVALLFMLIYALGQYTPVFSVLFHALPGVNAFRRPADATFFIGGLAAIMAGYLVHRLMLQAYDALSDIQRLGGLAILAGVFGLAFAVAVIHGQSGVVLKPLLTSALWFGLAGLAAFVLTRIDTARLAVAIPALIAVVMTADLFVNNGPNESTALPSALYDVLNPDCKNPTLAFIKKRLKEEQRADYRNRVEIAGLGFEWPNAGMVHGFDNLLGYNPLRLASFEEATHLPDTVAAPDQRTFSPLMPSYKSHLANLFGIRYIATSVPVERIDRKLKSGDLTLIQVTKDGYIYENPNALPRVMVVNDWRQANFDDMIETGLWPEGFDPRKVVLFEGEPDVIPPLSAGRTRKSEPSAALKSYANTLVEVNVESPRAGFLVLNDVYHPWWKATVNGETTEILKANVLFRAVRIPAGKSYVRFEFAPIAGAIAEIRQKMEGEREEAAESESGG